MDQSVIAHRVITLITGSFLLFLFTIGVPTISAVLNDKIPTSIGAAIEMRIQVTPTVDPTVTTLEKEKLQHENDWIWSNGATLLSTLAIVIGALFGLYRWLRDQRSDRDKRAEDQRIEQKKRDEERFQAIIGGLGSEKPESRVGSAIMLRTFLHPGYEAFYGQVLDLAVASLRLRAVDPNKPEPLDSLNQALSIVFKESFPLARNELGKKNTPFSSQYLDASHVQLDNTYLAEADLAQVWMPDAYLRATDLKEAHVTKANLSRANLSEANLLKTQLNEANLSEANLSWTNLSNANLTNTNLTNTNLLGANLTEADLTGANLMGTNPEKAQTLQKTKLINVVGLTKNQLDSCAARGALL